MDEDHLLMHAESLALRKLLLQISDLVTQRMYDEISEVEFFEAVRERSEVFKNLELPHLQEIIDQLEKL